MTVSTIGVADADVVDKYLHTNQRTISSTAREDQYVLPGEGAYPTYSALAVSISIGTANAHVLQIMGDGSNYTRIKRITMTPTSDLPAAVSNARFRLVRLSTAGTGGSSVTPAPFDSADTYGGGSMTLPSSKGTTGAILLNWRMTFPTAYGASQYTYAWEQKPGMKPIICGTATSNGLAIEVMDATTSCAVDATIEFITTSYL